MIERFCVFYLTKLRTKRLIESLTFSLYQQNLDDAIITCKTNGLVGELFAAAIERKEKSKEIIEESIERNATKVTIYLERNLQILATIGSTAPFIGLLGTVFGIIKTFKGISLIQYSYATNIITNGIAQALVNTAAGLLVSIPAIIAYNFFTTKINRFLEELEVYSSEVIETLKEQNNS
jgi:biopolymer transport protein ExbB/TolQ